MSADTLWLVLAVVLVCIGVAGSVLPALPGVPLVFAGLLLAALLYAPGALLFAWARREQGRPVFKGLEWALFIAFVVLAVVAGVALFNGTSKL